MPRDSPGSPSTLLGLDAAHLASVPLDHAVESVLAAAQARLTREREEMQRRVDDYTMQQELALQAMEVSIERAKQIALRRLEESSTAQPAEVEATSPHESSVLGATLMASLMLDEPRNKSPSLVRPSCRFVGFGSGASSGSSTTETGASISAAPTKLSLHAPACRSTLALEIGSFAEESTMGLAAANRKSDWPPPAPPGAPARPRLADEGRSDSDDAPSPNRFATRRAANDEVPAELPSSLPIQIHARNGRHL